MMNLVRSSIAQLASVLAALIPRLVAALAILVAAIRSLNADGILIQARFWTDSLRSDFMATSCRARLAIVVALKNAGIGLPDPNARVISPDDIVKWQATVGTVSRRLGDAKTTVSPLRVDSSQSNL